MRTLYRMLLLLMLTFLAACAAGSPAVTQPPQSAAPTKTLAADATATVPPTDLSTEPSAVPTEAPPGNISNYNLSAQVVESRDQLWEVEAVRGEVTSANANAQDYNRISVSRKDNSQRWVYEEYTNHGLGEGVPSGFTFTRDGKFLVFYDRGAADGGCELLLNSRLRRMDLSTGAIELVEGFDREGRFSLSPDGVAVAEVVDASIVLTDLQSGEQRAIPYEQPEGGSAGHRDILWSEDARWLAFDLINNYGSCDQRPELLDTIVVDTAAGSARLLQSPDNIVGAMHWAEPGQLVVQTGRDNPAKVDVTTGEAREFPLNREELMAKQAESTLRFFLRGLYEGRFDPARYAEVEKLFGGWELLTTRYATMRFTGNDAMLRHACEQDNFRCYPVRQVIFTGKEPGSEGMDLYRFQVEFLGPEGGPLVVGGQSVFDFTMEVRFPEITQIYQLPPLEE